MIISISIINTTIQKTTILTLGGCSYIFIDCVSKKGGDNIDSVKSNLLAMDIYYGIVC